MSQSRFESPEGDETDEKRKTCQTWERKYIESKKWAKYKQWNVYLLPSKRKRDKSAKHKWGKLSMINRKKQKADGKYVRERVGKYLGT